MRAKEPWRSEVCNSPCDFDLLPHMEEGRFEFPSRVSHSFQGPAGQSAPGTAATAVSTSPLGFVPRKRPPVRRRNPVEVKSALSIH